MRLQLHKGTRSEGFNQALNPTQSLIDRIADVGPIPGGSMRVQLHNGARSEGLYLEPASTGCLQPAPSHGFLERRDSQVAECHCSVHLDLRKGECPFVAILYGLATHSFHEAQHQPA